MLLAGTAALLGELVTSRFGLPPPELTRLSVPAGLALADGGFVYGVVADLGVDRPANPEASEE